MTATVSGDLPAVVLGSDATTIIGRASNTGKVTSATYVPAADITGAATNNRSFTLINKGQDGNGSTVMATLAFGNGVNATDFMAKDIPVSGTPANLKVVAGDVLAVQSLHVGTGIADPGGFFSVTIDTTGHTSTGYVRGFP